jgi:hypothetical protein
MKLNKKTIAMLSTLVVASHTHGMWPSKDAITNAVASALATSSSYAQAAGSSIAGYASAAKPALEKAGRKAWSTLKENKGYIGAAAAATGLVYGGYKAYQRYTQQDTQPQTPVQSSNSAEEVAPEAAQSATCDFNNIFTSTEGNVLKVVMNADTGFAKFIFVNDQGEAVTEREIKVQLDFARTTKHYFYLGKWNQTDQKVVQMKKLGDKTAIELIKLNKEDGSFVSCHQVIL